MKLNWATVVFLHFFEAEPEPGDVKELPPGGRHQMDFYELCRATKFAVYWLSLWLR